MKTWNVDADNIVISKLIKTKTNSRYFIRYLDKVIRPLVLILPKINGLLKVKDGDKDKNYKLMFLGIDDDKLLEKYKTILTNIEDLRTIEKNIDDVVS